MLHPVSHRGHTAKPRETHTRGQCSVERHSGKCTRAAFARPGHTPPLPVPAGVEHGILSLVISELPTEIQTWVHMAALFVMAEHWTVPSVHRQM